MTRPPLQSIAALLLSFAVAGAGAGAAGGEILAVRTADAELAAAVREGFFFRWLAPRLDGVETRLGADAGGDFVVVAALLPAPEIAAQLEGLPLHLDDGAIVFDGTAYRRPQHALALRRPGGGPETWLVVGRQRERIAFLINQLLAGAADERYRRGEDFDYLLVESRYLRRTGRWLDRATTGDGTAARVAIDRASERDGMAERDRDWQGKAAIPGRRVVLRVPPRRRTEAALVELARQLDAAAAAMAQRIPVVLERPLVVVVEEDYVALGRYLGRVEEAVVPEADAGAAGDVHLVFHEQDLDAYRFAVAAALLRRAGIELPPWLADGAALWLSRGWYGQPYGGYLPALAAGDVLPTAAELLAAERQRDGSRVLWAPVAAAVIERLRGDGLRRKLA
ncbi:MAG: hypothetical protein D6696_15550, partial [Acidobacteria bacterium]